VEEPLNVVSLQATSGYGSSGDGRVTSAHTSARSSNLFRGRA
jgi:hypothetical protein